MNRFLLWFGAGLMLMGVTPARADFSWEVEITVHYSEAPQVGAWNKIWGYECSIWDRANNRWVSLGQSAMWDPSHSYTWKTSLPLEKANGRYFVQIVKTKGSGERVEYSWDRISWRVLRDQVVPYRVQGGWSGSIHYVKLDVTL